MPLHDKVFKVSLSTLCFMILGMVLIGGLTRLTGSGLSIVEWKPVTGILFPLTHADWILEFSKYQRSPEFQQINLGMTLDDFKSIFFLEYIHRLWGRLIGFALLIPTSLILFKRQHRELMPLLALLWGLGLAQGIMGWLMVKSGLIHDPHVSPYRLTAHLFLGFMIFGVTLWMTLRTFHYPLSWKAYNKLKHLRTCHYENKIDVSTNPFIHSTSALRAYAQDERVCDSLAPFVLSVAAKQRSRRMNSRRQILRKASIIALSLILLTACFGGLVAGLKAGLIYNTFPLMGNSFIPRELLTQSPWWKDLLENPVSVQFLHRFCAIATVVYCGGLWGYQRRFQLSPPLTTAFNGMMIFISLQLALGLLTLLFVVPLSLALLHQEVAFLVFGSLVYVIFLINHPHSLRQADKTNRGWAKNNFLLRFVKRIWCTTNNCVRS